MKKLMVAGVALAISISLFAQQPNPPAERVQRTLPSQRATRPVPPNPEEPRRTPETRHEPEAQQEAHPSSPSEMAREAAAARALHWDMHELPPSVTHHQITINGRPLRYTATAGRLPIKDASGNTEALMFYVAYTADGENVGTRPLTFAFNGGPGSASLWLHMGALGPRKVVLQPEGWMPAAPYRLEDNQNTILAKSDLVMVDAIGTGFSRPASVETGRKFWNVQGDIASFGEFIRLYITRNERWSSPLYLLGESYGTTRSAGISGYLADRGISFNGIMLLSTVLDFETLEFTRRNDEAFPLTLPTYTMIAAYHKRLAPDLMQDLNRTREEAVRFALGDYAHALAAGDALPPQQRQAVIDQISRFTGLPKNIIDLANLRIDVQLFTKWLLADQKLRVGRLDGRYTGPDPEGFFETRFYDPSGAETGPPFTSVFNDYVRRELGYKTDMPYYVSAQQLSTTPSRPGERPQGPFQWEWGSAREGFPDTASALRSAMVKNPWLKVMVMEGYYDLATPFAAANYTMDHLNLAPQYRKNISYATYDSGHMVYLDSKSLVKMNHDVGAFIDATAPKK